jgi:raffinose synthase
VDGVAILRIESGDENVHSERWDAAVLLACGDDPFSLVEAAVAEAARLSGGAKPLHEKKLPPSVDVFGWCSWDSFYSAVSAKGEPLTLVLVLFSVYVTSWAAFTFKN